MSSSFFRGQRFRIDLDSDPDSDSDSGSSSENENDYGNGNDSGNGNGVEGNKRSERASNSKKTTNAKSRTRNTVGKSEALSPGDKIIGGNKSNSNSSDNYNKEKQPDDTSQSASQPLRPSQKTMPASMSTPMSLIADVCERRPPSTSSLEDGRVVPLPPDLNKGTVGSGSLATGFPAHRRRRRMMRDSGLGLGSGSVFRNGRKLQSGEKELGRTDRDGIMGASDSVATGTPSTTSESRERSSSIDRENRAKLAAMTPAEIERERDELMAQLSPAFVERLMKRVNIDHRQGDGGGGVDGLNGDGAEFPELQRRTSVKMFEGEDEIQDGRGQNNKDSSNTAKTPDTNPSKKIVSFVSPSSPSPPSPSSIKPDRPPSPRTIRRLYFPDQPPPDAIPALSWTLPLPSTSSSSSSNPRNNKTSLSISALRFSLNGTLIPPSVAESLPVTLGLHHHAADPDVAGYTIAELTRLSRSAVPAQRCVAIKALGGVAGWMAEQMQIERVGREDETDNNNNNNNNNDHDGNKVENGNGAGTKDAKEPDQDKDKDEGLEEEGEDNPRVALLKGLWTLAKDERVLDILRFEADIDDIGEEEKQQQQQQQQDQKSYLRLHRHHHHHQSVRVYAEDALKAWRVVEKQMRVRRAV